MKVCLSVIPRRPEERGALSLGGQGRAGQGIEDVRGRSVLSSLFSGTLDPCHDGGTITMRWRMEEDRAWGMEG